MIRSLILTTLFCAISGYLLAQDNSTDTLSQIRTLNESYEYHKALDLSEAYYLDHPQDLYAGWVHAQTLFHARMFRRSQVIYKKTIVAFPGEKQIRLDFASKLVMMGEFDKGDNMLRSFLQDDPKNLAARTILARSYLWQGYYDRSSAQVDQVLEDSPAHSPALDILRQIEEITSPKLWVTTTYSSDDQPLQSVIPRLNGSLYVNSWLTLKYGLQTPWYQAHDNSVKAQWLFGGTRLSFNRSKTIIDVEAGLINHPVNEIYGTGKVSFDQRIFDHLSFRLSAKHSPYLFTIASLSDPTLVLNYQAGLTWEKENSWNGEASVVANNFYSDQNWQYSAGAWVLTPPVHLSIFRLKVGYGFNFSTTEKDKFESDLTLEEVRDIWADSTTQIPGTYRPYFTPNDQAVHMLIASVGLDLGKVTSLGIQGNYGLSATIQQPYLYLDSENNADFINKDFYEETYSHLELKADLDVDISASSRIRFNYAYTQSVFYTDHTAGITYYKSF